MSPRTLKLNFWPNGRLRVAPTIGSHQSCVSLGLSPKEVAAQLGLATSTVYCHLENVKKKLGLRTSTDIFQAAYEWLRQSGIQP